MEWSGRNKIYFSFCDRWRAINRYLTNGENKIAIDVSYAVNEKGDIWKDKACKVGLTYSVKEKGSEQSYKLGELNYQATSGTMLDNPDKAFMRGSTENKFLAVKDGKVENVASDQAQFQIGTPKIIANDTAYYAFDFDTKKIEPNAGASVSNTLNLQLPYENKALTEGEIIPFNDSTRTELISFFKQILKDIEDKNEVSLNKTFAPQMYNNSASLYVPESKTNTVKDIISISNNSAYKLITNLSDDDMRLSVFGNGKLAQLTNWDSTSFFDFNRVEGQGSTTYNLTFAKINGQWKVVM